jgi:hypothetical protein
MRARCCPPAARLQRACFVDADVYHPPPETPAERNGSFSFTHTDGGMLSLRSHVSIARPAFWSRPPVNPFRSHPKAAFVWARADRQPQS